MKAVSWQADDGGSVYPTFWKAWLLPNSNDAVWMLCAPEPESKEYLPWTKYKIAKMAERKGYIFYYTLFNGYAVINASPIELLSLPYYTGTLNRGDSDE